MGNEKFLEYLKYKKMELVSLMGAPGAGVEFTSQFMQEYLGFKKIRKATTKSSTMDTVDYIGFTPEQFVELQKTGHIIGYFKGDRKTCDGVGEGYWVEDIASNLEKNKKVILLPNMIELSNGFAKDYGKTQKFGLGFKTAQGAFDTVIKDARISRGAETISGDIIEVAVNNGLQDTYQMQQYLKDKNDANFNLIYVDGYGENVIENKKSLLRDVTGLMGYDSKKIEDYINDYMSR